MRARRAGTSPRRGRNGRPGRDVGCAEVLPVRVSRRVGPRRGGASAGWAGVPAGWVGMPGVSRRVLPCPSGSSRRRPVRRAPRRIPRPGRDSCACVPAAALTACLFGSCRAGAAQALGRGCSGVRSLGSWCVSTPGARRVPGRARRRPAPSGSGIGPGVSRAARACRGDPARPGGHVGVTPCAARPTTRESAHNDHIAATVHGFVARRRVWGLCPRTIFGICTAFGGTDAPDGPSPKAGRPAI